ncbi:hypothetical protein E2C01_001486 [Portunus trituberculatus]|uniref:Uncharacterized protein n=1 Tax=Portunus trituberculatus TaxID=210409 RepID=A0A5B7CJE9_PORTR|nr:hypothetical protein [Portunus trituberculatus]
MRWRRKRRLQTPSVKKNKSLIPHPTACDSETMICKAPTDRLESCFERPTENTENGGPRECVLYLLRMK